MDFMKRQPIDAFLRKWSDTGDGDALACFGIHSFAFAKWKLNSTMVVEEGCDSCVALNLIIYHNEVSRTCFIGA